MDAILSSTQAAREAFRRAVDAIEGGQSGLARLIGKTQSAVSKRLAAGELLWAEHVLAVEVATGISRHELRPDLYPREDQPLAPPATSGVGMAGGPSSDDRAHDALQGVRS